MKFVAAAGLALALLLCTWVQAAHAQKRIALLIGNQSYASEIGPLINPHNDVALLAQTLKGLNFEVSTVLDADLAGLHRAVNSHVRRARAAGPDAVAFFYYSGHGAQDATTGTNYLIPTDATSAEDTMLWDQSLRLTEVTRKLKAEADNAMHFVVFDACRNGLKLRRTGTRSLLQSKGFVPVREESGMLIAYATAEGELASDVGVGAGPYAKALAEEIVRPGIEAVSMFRRVQVRVRSAIGQNPYIGFNALNEVHFAGTQAEPSRPSPAPAPPPPQLSEAERAWKSLERSADIRDFEAFRRQYGQANPFHDRQAEARIEALRKRQIALAEPPAGPQPQIPPKSPPNAGAWIELGCQQVSLGGNDRDVVRVGRREGRIKAIRLHVRGADVEMLDVRVIYAMGQPDDIPVRQFLRAGDRTRPLDLRGWERTIHRVDMVYRAAANFKGGLATVCVEGLS
jgi:uncharacterized caspase-like protein